MVACLSCVGLVINWLNSPESTSLFYPVTLGIGTEQGLWLSALTDFTVYNRACLPGSWCGPLLTSWPCCNLRRWHRTESNVDAPRRRLFHERSQPWQLHLHSNQPYNKPLGSSPKSLKCWQVFLKAYLIRCEAKLLIHYEVCCCITELNRHQNHLKKQFSEA